MQTARQDFFTAARQIVERQQAAHTAAWTGVHYSGLEPDAPRVETVENVALRLEREAQRCAEWRLTPGGRFYVAAHAIYAATGDDRLLNCHSRGLATNADLAACMLDRMEGPAADEARAALLDLSPLQIAAE